MKGLTKVAIRSYLILKDLYHSYLIRKDLDRV